MARYVESELFLSTAATGTIPKNTKMESVVYDQVSGNSYISRKTVPAGNGHLPDGILGAVFGLQYADGCWRSISRRPSRES